MRIKRFNEGSFGDGYETSYLFPNTQIPHIPKNYLDDDIKSVILVNKRKIGNKYYLDVKFEDDSIMTYQFSIDDYFNNKKRSDIKIVIDDTKAKILK